MDVIQVIVLAFSALVGFPAFLTALLNLLMFLKVPLNPDGFYFWANVIAFGGVAVAVFTGRTDILSSLDAALAGLAKILVDILILAGGAAGALFVNYRMHAGIQARNVRSPLR